VRVFGGWQISIRHPRKIFAITARLRLGSRATPIVETANVEWVSSSKFDWICIFFLGWVLRVRVCVYAERRKEIGGTNRDDLIRDALRGSRSWGGTEDGLVIGWIQLGGSE
jgi:hypothetical protein